MRHPGLECIPFCSQFECSPDSECIEPTERVTTHAGSHVHSPQAGAAGAQVKAAHASRASQPHAASSATPSSTLDDIATGTHQGNVTREVLGQVVERCGGIVPGVSVRMHGGGTEVDGNDTDVEDVWSIDDETAGMLEESGNSKYEGLDAKYGYISKPMVSQVKTEAGTEWLQGSEKWIQQMEGMPCVAVGIWVEIQPV